MPQKASRPRTSPPADQGAWGIGILADAPAVCLGSRGTGRPVPPHPTATRLRHSPMTHQVAIQPSAAGRGVLAHQPDHAPDRPAVRRVPLRSPPGHRHPRPAAGPRAGTPSPRGPGEHRRRHPVVSGTAAVAGVALVAVGGHPSGGAPLRTPRRPRRRSGRRRSPVRGFWRRTPTPVRSSRPRWPRRSR